MPQNVVVSMSVAVNEFNFESSCTDVLPEKIIGDQLVKKIPSSYGPRNSLACLQDLVRVSYLSCVNIVYCIMLCYVTSELTSS